VNVSDLQSHVPSKKELRLEWLWGQESKRQDCQALNSYFSVPRMALTSFNSGRSAARSAIFSNCE
jgi:hypothetical protein